MSRENGRMRRKSVNFTNSPLGIKFKETLKSVKNSYASGPEYKKDMEEFLQKYTELTNTTGLYRGEFVGKEKYSAKRTFSGSSDVYVNVATILLFVPADPIEKVKLGFGHAVPYVRINGDWYKGDNEKGFLELRENGPPSWDIIYSNTYPWIVEYMYKYYVNEVLYNDMLSTKILPEELIPERKFHGQITFKQTEAACWADSIQSILMNADGYREIFSNIYADIFFNDDCNRIIKSDGSCEEYIVSKQFQNLLSQTTDEGYQYKDALLTNIYIKLLRISNITNYSDPLTMKTLKLLSFTFFRMVSWGTIPWKYGPYVDYILGSSGPHLIKLDPSAGESNVNMSMNVGGYSKNKKSRTRKSSKRR